MHAHEKTHQGHDGNKQPLIVVTITKCYLNVRWWTRFCRYVIGGQCVISLIVLSVELFSHTTFLLCLLPPFYLNMQVRAKLNL